MSEIDVEEIVDELRERNDAFAAEHDVAGLPLLPTRRTMILTCVDPRVDPAHMLGVELGEAAVIRNLGGRVTPAILRTLALLAAIALSDGATPGPGWNLVVMHHTDCGIARLTGFPDALAAEFGVPADEIDQDALVDPRASLVADLAALHANPMLPAALTVSGLLYDTANGRIETVVQPALLDPARIAAQP